MVKNRSKLLVALVLIGVLGSTAGRAHADLVKFTANPNDAIGNSYQPGSNPDAGEPDNPINGPSRLEISRARGEGEPVVGSSTRIMVSLAEKLRWTWVIWMARYLNQAP